MIDRYEYDNGKLSRVKGDAPADDFSHQFSFDNLSLVPIEDNDVTYEQDDEVFNPFAKHLRT